MMIAVPQVSVSIRTVVSATTTHIHIQIYKCTYVSRALTMCSYTYIAALWYERSPRAIKFQNLLTRSFLSTFFLLIEGKCIYVYGRKRDLCHRNTDCKLGMSCLKSAAGNLMCQPSASTAHLLNAVGGVVGAAGIGVGDGGVLGGSAAASNNAVGFDVGANMATAPKLTLNTKQFGEDCISSSDCNVSK